MINTIVFYGITSGGSTTPEQSTHEHVACPECRKCTATDCDGAETDKCLGHEEQPTHEHDVCAECGKCTSEECDGTMEKCEGHEEQPSVGEEITATLSFDDKASRTEFSTTKQVWKQNGITFTNNKSNSTNNVADYAKPVRLYANSEVVIEADGDITKIVFDCGSDSYATALKNSIDNVSNATVAVSSDKVTVTFSSPVESFTIEKLTAQVRVDSISVTYIS